VSRPVIFPVQLKTALMFLIQTLMTPEDVLYTSRWGISRDHVLHSVPDSWTRREAGLWSGIAARDNRGRQARLGCCYWPGLTIPKLRTSKSERAGWALTSLMKLVDRGRNRRWGEIESINCRLSSPPSSISSSPTPSSFRFSSSTLGWLNRSSFSL
jgi:hypothetical protein